MSNYVESATLIVLDEASRPVNKITKELRALARAAATLKDAFKSNNSSDKLNVLSRTMDTAAREAGKVRAQLSGVNAELSKMAALGVRAGRSGSGLSAAALGLGKRSLAREAAEEARTAAQLARQGANAQISLARDVAAAQTRAEREVAGASRSQVVALRNQESAAAAAAREMNRLAGAEMRAAKAAREETSAFVSHNVRGFVHGSHLAPVTALGAGMAGFAVGRVLHDTEKQMAARDQELYQQRQRGFTPEEIERNYSQAEGMSRKYKMVSVTEGLRIIRESSDKAENLEASRPLADIGAMVYQNSARFNPSGDEASRARDVSNVRKGAEISGKLVDINGKTTPHNYELYADTIAKLQLLEGSQFNSAKALQAAVMLKTNGSALSEDALARTYFLASELGGGRAGNMSNMMINQLTGVTVPASRVAMQKELGLVDADVDYGGNGTVKRVKYHTTDGEQQLRTDPMGWINDHILEKDGALDKFAMRKDSAGLTFAKPDPLPDDATPEQAAAFEKASAAYKVGIAKFSNSLFGNTNASNNLTKLILQANESTNKLAALHKISIDQQKVEMATAENYNSAKTAAMTQLDNVLGAIGIKAAPGATRALDRFAAAAGHFSEDLRSHPLNAGITTAELAAGGVGAALLGRRTVSFLTGLGRLSTVTSGNTLATEANTAALTKGAIASKVGVGATVAESGVMARGGLARAGGGLLKMAGLLTEVGVAAWAADAALDAFAPDLHDKLTTALGDSLKDIGRAVGVETDSPLEALMRQARIVQKNEWLAHGAYDDSGGLLGHKQTFAADAGDRNAERQALIDARKAKEAQSSYEASQANIKSGKDTSWFEKGEAAKGFVAGLVAELRELIGNRSALAPDVNRMVEQDYKDRLRNAPENSPEAKHGAALGKLPIEEISAAIERTSAGLGSLADPAEHAGSALATIPGTAAAFNGALGSMIERMNSANISISATIAAPATASTGGMPAPHG